MRSSKVTTQITQIEMQQAKYKKSFKFILTGIASLMTVTSLSMMPASAELSAVDTQRDTTNKANSLETGYPLTTGGFPRWYQDTRTASPLKLDLCTDLNGMCLFDPPEPSLPVSFPNNFPDEAFYWTTEAQADGRNVSALLVLATEAAFAEGDVFDGDQITFNRIRIRVQGTGLTPGNYRVTHPYGTINLQATLKDPRKPAAGAQIRYNNDFGCAVTPGVDICNFGVLSNKGRNYINKVGAPWLTWTTFNTNSTSLDPVISGKYVGDPNVDHRINPGLNGVDYFRVERINSNGSLTLIAQTNLFSVSGKVSTTP